MNDSKLKEQTFEEACKRFGIKKEEIEADPLLRESVKKILKYNEEADTSVDKVMHIIQGMLKEEKNIFSVYLMLAKCMNYTSQVFCKDYDDFMEQVQKAHVFANDTIMPVFESSNENGAFDIKQMLFTASSIIEYLIWSEASGDIELQEDHPKEVSNNVTQLPN